MLGEYSVYLSVCHNRHICSTPYLSKLPCRVFRDGRKVRPLRWVSIYITSPLDPKTSKVIVV